MDFFEIMLQQKLAGGGGDEPEIEALSITENGTYTAPSGVDGYSPVTVNVSGGGGGDSNIISGEFTAQATEGTQTITIPYEGTGYPIMIRILAESIPTLVDENKGSIVAFVGLAKYMGNAPTYASGYYDKMVVGATHIASDLTFNTPNGANITIYSSNGSPVRTAASGAVIIASATQIKINVETSGTGGWVGFRANKKYSYEVVYSS